MPSAASRLMPVAIRLRGSKKRYLSRQLTLERIARQQRNPASFEPPTLAGVTVERSEVDGWPVFTVSAMPTGRTALYLHGGSFVYQIAKQHWTLIADLVRTTGTTITVPIYPLAPAGTAATVIPAVAELAGTLGEPVLIGDSAGGAIALGAAQILRDRGIRLRTILISPELDLTLTDPMLRKIEPWDPWLAIPGAAVANELWAGDLPLTDPLVSPMFGSLEGLAPVTLFCGTRDMLHADATTFVTRAARAGVPVDFHEARGMIHVYPLLPIPEGRAARDVIRAALTAEG